MLTTTRARSFARKTTLRLSRFFADHMMVTLLLLFMGLPVALLLGVTVFAALVSLPLAVLFGWF